MKVLLINLILIRKIMMKKIKIKKIRINGYVWIMEINWILNKTKLKENLYNLIKKAFVVLIITLVDSYHLNQYKKFQMI
jgi:hypothetical protein